METSYAAKYKCPQVLYFDGETLLLLQFRANAEGDIQLEDLVVDCWVLPRARSGTPFRYALYMLLLQGFRRLQGMSIQLFSPLRRQKNGSMHGKFVLVILLQDKQCNEAITAPSIPQHLGLTNSLQAKGERQDDLEHQTVRHQNMSFKI